MAQTICIILGVLFVSQILPSLAVKVQIYRDLDFKGLIYEYSSDDPNTPLTDCHTIKEYARGEAGSLKTDTCLIGYEDVNCAGFSYKLSRDMTDELANLARKMSSFHPCNSTHGGRKIRVDMFQDNTLLGEYHDICGCQDMPTQVSTALTSLKNYGNCVAVYSTETCSGDKFEIAAGHNQYTANLRDIGFRVRSVSGCGTRRACYLLDAQIYKFKILPDESRAAIMATQQDVELATKTIIHNNGSATLTQEYEASKEVTESTTFERSKTIMSMNTHNVESSASVEVSAEAGMWFAKVSTKVSASISYAYERTDSEENSESESYTHEEKKTFAVKQTIEIPPCSQYEVQSMVSMAENYPVRYEVYTKVTGRASGERMTAEEVAQQVDELTFVEYLDQWTAIFKSSHSIVASVGVDTFISGEGEDIAGCSIR